MTTEQHRALVQYVNECACLLELHDWRFRVHREPPRDASSNAAFNAGPRRRCASLWFSDGFMRDDPENQRQTVAHELLHAHLNGVRHMVAGVEDHMSRAVYDVWDDAFNTIFESAVDAIAYAIAPRLPLPELPR